MNHPFKGNYPLFLVVCAVFCFHPVCAQKGRDGAKTISTNNVIVNEYTSLTTDAHAGNAFVKVNNSAINSNSRFTNPLSQGDLIMIIQVQGATIKGNVNDSTWGSISSYNNCGLYEFAEVASVPDNATININCPLLNNYTSAGKTEVVRVPRYASLTINTNDTLTCEVWNGITGGIVALEIAGNSLINAGGAISASACGFRGGLTGSNGGANVNTTYVAASGGGAKGEGIVGYTTDYANLGGAYTRGAPANGGGGGNSWNCPGGGGANAGNIHTYSGNGNPDIATNVSWITAWNLEYPGFDTTTSSGGGRGGYSVGSALLNPLVVGPDNANWDPNFHRCNTGGKGGRPLDYSSGRIFLAGGGGGGHEDNGHGGNGGSGGGIVYLLSYGAMSGTGSIISNGQNGQDELSPNELGDGAGGAGAGGTVILNFDGTINGITIYANGGNGGNQHITNSPLHDESEGPGGGGGGGYIAISNGTITTQAYGGNNGITDAIALTAFPPNGATKGGNGLPNQVVSNLPLSQLAITTSGAASICKGATANLSASGGVNYIWTPAGSLSCDTCPDPLASPLKTTTYTVTVSNEFCSATDSIVVTVLNNINAGTITAPSDTICRGSSVDLVTTGGPANLQWQSSVTGNNFANIPGADTTFYFSQPGQTTYYRVCSTGGACPDTSAVFSLTVFTLPTPTPFTSDSVICYSDSAFITVPGNYATYLWSDGDTSSYTYVSYAGNYYVTVTDGNGCAAISTPIKISVYPVPSAPVVEEGSTLSSFDGALYQWYYDGSVIPGATNPVYIARQTGNYAVLVTDTNGCSSLSQYAPVIVAGIAGFSEDNWLSVYPNPFTQTLYIKMENAGTITEGIEIYDMSGKRVINKVYGNSNQTADLMPIDVSVLEQGTYLVNIITNTGKLARTMVKE